MNKTIEKKKYKSCEQKDLDWTAIGQLCRKIDLPHLVGNKFICKTESETEEIIEAFMKWYDSLFANDILSKEQWLGIYRYKTPHNIGQQLLSIAITQLPKSERRQLSKALPNLYEAFKEFKKNGYK